MALWLSWHYRIWLSNCLFFFWLHEACLLWRLVNRICMCTGILSSIRQFTVPWVAFCSREFEHWWEHINHFLKISSSWYITRALPGLVHLSPILGTPLPPIPTTMTSILSKCLLTLCLFAHWVYFLFLCILGCLIRFMCPWRWGLAPRLSVLAALCETVVLKAHRSFFLMAEKCHVGMWYGGWVDFRARQTCSDPVLQSSDDTWSPTCTKGALLIGTVLQDPYSVLELCNVGLWKLILALNPSTFPGHINPLSHGPWILCLFVRMSETWPNKLLETNK